MSAEETRFYLEVCRYVGCVRSGSRSYLEVYGCFFNLGAFRWFRSFAVCSAEESFFRGRGGVVGCLAFVRFFFSVLGLVCVFYGFIFK